MAQLAEWRVLLFCQCGSDRVDLKLWNVRRAQLHCLTCGHEAWLEGFSVREFDPAKLLTAAVIDQAGSIGVVRRRTSGGAPEAADTIDDTAWPAQMTHVQRIPVTWSSAREG